MNICLYSNFLPQVGGIETSSLALASGFHRLGHHVTLVSDTPAPPGYDLRFPFKVDRCPDPSNWERILEGNDILVSNGHSLRHLGQWRRSGIPFGWIHGMLLGGSLREGLRSFLRLHTRRLFTHVGYFNICVSEAMKRHIRNRKAVVIPNAVNPMFRPLPALGHNERLLFFGRMIKCKGMDTLLRAVAMCRDENITMPVDFYGEGVDLPATRKLAEQLHLLDRVDFHPFAHDEELVAVINRSLAVVVPSTWDEPFGLTAAESLACGKCVIGTRRGGLGEILEGYGPTFDNGDSAQLAAILVDLHHHPEKRRRYEELALRRSADFQIDTVCRGYLQFFEHVLGKARRRSAHR